MPSLTQNLSLANVTETSNRREVNGRQLPSTMTIRLLSTPYLFSHVYEKSSTFAVEISRKYS